MSAQPPPPPAGGDDQNTQSGSPPSGQGSQPPPPQQSTPPPPPQQSAPPPPPAAQQQAPRVSGQAATLGTRLGARLIDFVLLWIVSLVIVVPLLIGAIFSDVSAGGGFGFTFSIGSFIASLVSAAIYVGYFAFLESSRGQTLGKQLLNIKTIGPDGGNPTMEQAVKRNAWLALGIVPVLGGLLTLAAAIWIIVTISNEQQTPVHDEFAGGTAVVNT